MSTATIFLEADKVVWDMPALQPDGGLLQLVRLYEGDDCRVSLTVHFSKDSTEAKEWALSAARIANAKLETANLQRQRVRAGAALEMKEASPS